MKNSFKYFLTFFLLIVSTTINFAQYSYNYPFTKGWEIGGNFGLNYFYGDINDNKGRLWNNTPLSSFYYEQKRLMGNIIIGKSLTPYLGIRSHFIFGNIAGSNDKLKMYFNGNIIGLDADITFQYFDYFLKKPESSKFKSYTFVGLGLMKFNAIRHQIGNNLYLGSVGYNAKGDSKTNMITESMFKLGVGVSYSINKFWMFNYETSLNYLNTDKLDALISDVTKLEGYGYMSFGCVYKFNFNIRTKNNLWKSSSGTNNRPHNSGVNNKKKRKLHNKWKR
jgi:hypothetical protein